jgi:hypothetical protein
VLCFCMFFFVKKRGMFCPAINFSDKDQIPNRVVRDLKCLLLEKVNYCLALVLSGKQFFFQGKLA